MTQKNKKESLPKVTDEELQVIEECSLLVASSTWIPGYDTEDIRQEAIIIGIKGIHNYNGSIPLNKYLINHMRHRLRSLRKEKYTKPGCDCGKCLKCSNNESRIKISYPKSLEDINKEAFQYSQENELEKKELLEYLDKNIPAELREDYLKMLSGVIIVSSRRKKIRQIIQELLNDKF